MNDKKSTPEINRRSFLTGLLAAGGYAALPKTGVFGAASSIRPISPNEKVNIACIGIGNRGWDDIRGLAATGLVNIVALCDTQLGEKHTLDALGKFPDAKTYQDFRKMFDEIGHQFDAVSIAIPDHAHFPATMLAMSEGKHVYVEKPMGHSFRQIELMIAGEKKYKVACQMGNQGHSEANYFQFKAWKEAGIIKNVTRITAFMNAWRRWHGMTYTEYMPAEFKPESMDWDVWIATAHEHPYSRKYINGDWRSWYDFGNGALGDWGAHIIDTAHEFLDLGLPYEIAPTLDGYSPVIFPQASTLLFRFPKRGSMPPVDITWYDGQKNLPPLPPGFDGSPVDPNIPPPTSGTLATKTLAPGKVIYGEGLTFKGGTHGSTLEIIPKGADKDLKLPEVPKSPSNHYLNFIRACKGEEKCRSNFAVAGPLSQVLVLGVLAQRMNTKLEFDRATKRITNNKVADELLNGAVPRKDWEQYYKL
ncbi:MAG: gfo/Idh/MocA family oxidoreductase [Armatimonadetes bacterium]|nr:gfo/Idh/MocA family oxidoreductase [Armatimonadota bacterium]MBS1727672.1 Gfo/Idh/MocA family oxidoreductase [Armatimonadota bacterium]